MPKIRMLDTGGGARMVGTLPATKKLPEAILSDAGGGRGRIAVDAADEDPAGMISRRLQAAAFSVLAPLEAAARQSAVARALAGRAALANGDFDTGLVDAALDPIEQEVMHSAPRRPAGSSGAEDDVVSTTRRRIREQRTAVEATMRAAASRHQQEQILPSVLSRIRELAGDDPRRADAIIAYGREAAAAFAPFLGTEAVDEHLRSAEAEAVRALAAAALRRGDYAGAGLLLGSHGHNLAEAERDNIEYRIGLAQEAEKDEKRETARRLVAGLVHGGGGDEGLLTALRNLPLAETDAEIASAVEMADELSRFRRLDRTGKRAALERAKATRPDAPRTQAMAEVSEAEARLIIADPLEAARQMGAVTVEPFTLSDEETVARGSSIVRAGFEAWTATGGALRFTTNRQRDDLAEAFDAADRDGRVAQVDVLGRTFGMFARDVLREIAPAAPVMAAAGALQNAGFHRASRQLLDGLGLLQAEPSSLKESRASLREAVAAAVSESGDAADSVALSEVVLASYAAEALRTGSQAHDTVDGIVLEQALARILGTVAGEPLGVSDPETLQLHIQRRFFPNGVENQLGLGRTGSGG